MIRAYYNELTYIIYFNNKVIYQAGNHPLESQTYVAAKKGVGVKTMKEYCTITANEFAKEYGCKLAEIRKSRQLPPPQFC